jgi:iron complex outermembrane receptor protein
MSGLQILNRQLSCEVGRPPRQRALRLISRLALAAVLSAPAVTLQGQSNSSRDLTQVSLEDLMNVQVTSVSKKEQRLFKTAAAIFVIGQEDIQRSGATNIPDLLRMVPGAHVAQIDAHSWAISIRGLNDRYAQQVLILIDGRSVYSPTFSGVYWDQQDVPLEDIDRIEVIRGPGGTVWGANAVNGVINIITKSALATRGGLITAEAGTRAQGRGLLQYGGKIGRKGAYRAFGHYYDVTDSLTVKGTDSVDGWHLLHGGFRSDWNLSGRDTLTVQGDLMGTSEGQTLKTVFTNALPLEMTITDPITTGAGNVLARWNRTLSNGSDISLQAYYDHYHRIDVGLHESVNAVNVDFQHHLAWGSRQDLVWGLGYRSTGDQFTAGYALTFVPLRHTDHLFSSFVQDEIRLAGPLSLIVGSKFERNGYTGFEYEPSAQLSYSLRDRHSIWLAAARAIRQPSRSDFGLRVDDTPFQINSQTFGLLELQGNPARGTEQLHDYEAGYRIQANKRLSMDIVTFYSIHRGLNTYAPAAAFPAILPPPPHLVVPLIIGNAAHAHTYGDEAFVTWSAAAFWRISSGYTFTHMKIDLTAPGSGAVPPADNTPNHQFQIRSALNLRHNLDWDSAAYYVGRLPDSGAGATPAYVRLDTRLAWRTGEFTEFSLVGQNLLTPAHPEFPDGSGRFHNLVSRSILGKITWRF